MTTQKVPKHTGEITVRIYPVGQRGKVRYTIASTGPVALTLEETYYALLTATHMAKLSMGSHE